MTCAACLLRHARLQRGQLRARAARTRLRPRNFCQVFRTRLPGVKALLQDCQAGFQAGIHVLSLPLTHLVTGQPLSLVPVMQTGIRSAARNQGEP